MKFKHLKQISFSNDATIKEVLESFEKTAIYTEGKGFALIIDENNKCLGVVSEGDIRRKLLEDISIDEPIECAVNKDYISVKDSDDSHQVLRQFDKRISNIPVLDSSGIVTDIYQYSKFIVSARTGQKIIRARVPVRVSYSGGGTDMSDYINKTTAAVLSSTINKYCTASVITRGDREIHISSKDLNLKYSANSLDEIEFGDDLDLIKAAIKIMEPRFGFNLETFAEFDPGTGLGGSSALVVSVIGALNYFRNEQQLDKYQLADLAYQVERIDMKIDGGWQDQYATVFGGFSWIEFRENEVLVNPIMLQRNTLLELEYNLMLFRVGENRSSSLIQSEHIKTINEDKNLESFKQMIKLASIMKESLLRGDVKKFGDLMHDSWMLKQAMNKKVTSPLIEDCYNTARELGALGGKLLGAGGSGYLFIYASPLHQKKIKKALEDKGLRQEMFKFSNQGLEVWSTNR